MAEQPSSKDQLRAKSVDLFAQLRHQGHGYVADAFDNALAEIERLEQDNARFINSHEVLSLLLDTQRDRIKELEEANSHLMQDLLKGSIRIAEAEKRSAQPPKDARLERLEAFKDMILAGCTEELYCGPHPNDLWSTLSGECQPCKGSGVVRDANDKIVDCAVCRSTGVAPTKAEPPSDALLRRCYNELPNPEHEADFDKRQRLRDLFQDLVKAIQWPPPTKEGDGYGHCPECRAVPGTCVHSAGETPAPRTCFFCGSTEHSEVSDSPGAIVTRTTGCPVHDGQGEGYGPSASEPGSRHD